MARGAAGGWIKRCLWILAAGGLMLATIFYFRVDLLIEMAKLWAVNDPLLKSDAIVVLGGGVNNRPLEAAQLYHDGLAPRVLYMDVKLDPVEARGLVPTESELTRRVLMDNGVPESALQRIGTNVASTYDESQAVRAWAQRTGARSIIITTDLFHTRRARWIFRHALQGTNVRIEIQVAPLAEYGLNNWWESEGGVMAFESEIIKDVFYHLKY